MSDSEPSAQVRQNDVVTSLKAPLVALVILAVVTLMVLMAFDFGHEARRLPLFVGIPVVLLAATNLAFEVWGAVRKRGAREDSPKTVTSETDALLRQAELEPEMDQKAGLSLVVAIGMLALLTALYLALGQLLATPVFIIIAMRLASRRTWLSTVLTAIAMTAILYFLTAILDLPSYGGWLSNQWTWLNRVIH